MFTNFKQFNESIKLSQAKQYTKIWKDSNMANYMSKEFGNKYRIYLPIDINSIKIEPDENIKDEVVEFLSKNGYDIESYNANLCKKAGADKNFTKITKILQKFGETELLIAFNKDHEQLTKLADGYFVVISRHPVDIAGMTAGRRWKSCMNIDSGAYKQYVDADIKEGSIVAYLIKNDDKNIENPLSRILIKPYIYQKTGKTYLMPGFTYGTISEKFEETINNWLISVQGVPPTGEFKINQELYADRQGIKWYASGDAKNLIETFCEYLKDLEYDEDLKTIKIQCVTFNLKSPLKGITFTKLRVSDFIIDCENLQESDFKIETLEFEKVIFKNFDSDRDNIKLANLTDWSAIEIDNVQIHTDKQITSLEFLRNTKINKLLISANVKNIETDLNTIDLNSLKIVISEFHINTISSDNSFLNFIPKNQQCSVELDGIQTVHIEFGNFWSSIYISSCENLQITNKLHGKVYSLSVHSSNITTNVEDFNEQFVETGNVLSDQANFTNCTFHGEPYDFKMVFTPYRFGI